MDKATRQVICTDFTQGKCHDFKLFRNSKVRILSKTQVLMGSGYQGAQWLHSNTQLPSKRSKHHPLSKEQRQANRTLSQQRVSNEQAIGFIKRFKILTERYRNRRKRSDFDLTSSLASVTTKPQPMPPPMLIPKSVPQEV